MLLPYSSNEENRQNEATISTYYYLYLYIKMKEYLYYRFVFAQGNYQSLDTIRGVVCINVSYKVSTVKPE